jgi:hypothetical protein
MHEYIRAFPQEVTYLRQNHVPLFPESEYISTLADAGLERGMAMNIKNIFKIG